LALFPIGQDPFFARTKNLAKQEGFKDVNLLRVLPALSFVLIVSVSVRHGEESQTFVANAARTTAYDQYQSEMTAKAPDAAQSPQTNIDVCKPDFE
jgi:hypothetical protein